MSEILLIDESWTKANPDAIKKAGYVGVIGYATHDTTGKALTGARVDALHKAGLVVGLVFEDGATRAIEGKIAGDADAKFTADFAKALGYPEKCDRFFACDTDASGTQTHAYMAAVCGPNAGPYGDMRVAADVFKAHPNAPYWETQAWDGTVVSKRAVLYQRVGKSLPKIAGVAGNSYDENVVLGTLTLWGPNGPVTLRSGKAKPTPGEAHGFGRPMRDALRTVISRDPTHPKGRKVPLDAHADALAAEAEKALTRLRALK